ncbi:4Fe-4S dicluster domain-containing protein [Dictyobacter aurantiacus]|uniref:4Fe-4S ferredoxin n=1 Tax=Dictyobacter aurantiacus TaxID=1936993 RepID=A0A401ZSM1_9CHLR|nr:4Fe-4S dicluster domain-containing protein [Dictyobacter aurantiacus]GCE09863.1 4Fe-4S ferredoxin [Dictyobacter aurantiacus]
MYSSPSINDQLIMRCEQLEQLLIALRHRGYEVVGPTVHNEAIVYNVLTSINDLPRGYTDEQDGGVYRLKRRNDDAFFGYAVGPHSWKQFLHPSITRLWRAQRDEQGIHIAVSDDDSHRYAFIGVRSCELHAIAIQDRVFLQDAYIDPIYQERRKDLFIVALNCGQAGGTCFCTSMQTGPRATTGYDLALTEIIDAHNHFFVVQIGSEAGADIMHALECQPAGDEEIARAEQVVEQTARSMGRQMPTSPQGIKDLLARNLEHSRWDDVAQRCLSCTNCTMVCPTCFCTTIEDTTDLADKETERVRKWDSCFNVDFSYLYGGSVRTSSKSRYRQWMTHKLSTWFDQFGSSGCVGCGRCITWCPVGIDITEEACAIYDSEQKES